jgi:hypothetical protein
MHKSPRAAQHVGKVPVVKMGDMARNILAALAVLIFTACGSTGESPSGRPSNFNMQSIVLEAASGSPSASPVDLPSTTSFAPLTSPSSSRLVEPSLPPTFAPNPTVTPGSSGVFVWTKLASGGDGQVTWAPDSEHFFVQDGGIGQYHIQVFDAVGDIVKTFGAAEPMWLDSKTVTAFNGNAYPPSDPSEEPFADFHTVAGQSLDVLDKTIGQVELPCCSARSNGNGAVVIARNLPGIDVGPVNPSFEVWQGGQASPERDGIPLNWDLAGDKLAVLHPTESGPSPDGWLEILGWPGLKSLFSDHHPGDPSTIDFDPTGRYFAGAIPSRDSSGVSRLGVEITDLTTGSVANVPIVGDFSKEGEGYVWNDQGQIVTFTTAAPVLSTYGSDGIRVSKVEVPAGRYYVASAYGATLVGFRVDVQTGKWTDLIAYRGGAAAPLGEPDEVAGLFLSPDGRRIVISVGTPGQGAEYLADVPL